MYKTGATKVFEDLTLNEFTWFVKGVSYDWENSTASIEIIMQETGSALKHSRNYSFDCPIVWTDQDALNAILSLDQFKNSVEI